MARLRDEHTGKFLSNEELCERFNLEVFKHDDYHEEGELEPGWYWWSCCPGCLPDGEASGPFTTREEALADAVEPYLY